MMEKTQDDYMYERIKELYIFQEMIIREVIKTEQLTERRNINRKQALQILKKMFKDFKSCTGIQDEILRREDAAALKDLDYGSGEDE